MDGIISAIGLALTATVFALMIGKDAPGISFLLTLAAGIFILVLAMQGVHGIMDTLNQILRIADIDGTLYLPVLKAVGIAVIVRIASALCQDAGQSSLAVKLEIAGAVAAMTVTLPLFSHVLTLVDKMLT